MTNIQSLTAVSISADTYIPTLQDFIALTRNAGFSRTDRFAVAITPPAKMSSGPWQTRDLSVLCEEVSFPAKTLNTRTLRVHALNEQRAHTVDYGENITMTFLVDQSWQTRLFFEEWIRLCVGASSTNDIPSSPSVMREVEFYSNYIADIGIAALTPVGTNIPGGPLGGGIFSTHNLESAARAFITSNANTATASIKGAALGIAASNIVQQVLGAVENDVFPVNSSPVPQVPTVPAETSIYNIVLRECFPKSLEAQPMSSGATNQFHRLRVTFAYKYYTTRQQLTEHTN